MGGTEPGVQTRQGRAGRGRLWAAPHAPFPPPPAGAPSEEAASRQRGRGAGDAGFQNRSRRGLTVLSDEEVELKTTPGERGACQRGQKEASPGREKSGRGVAVVEGRALGPQSRGSVSTGSWRGGTDRDQNWAERETGRRSHRTTERQSRPARSVCIAISLSSVTGPPSSRAGGAGVQRCLPGAGLVSLRQRGLVDHLAWSLHWSQGVQQGSPGGAGRHRAKP